MLIPYVNNKFGKVHFMVSNESMDGAKKISQTVSGLSIVPFTAGIFAIYAFFWPAGYGHWLGTIVHAFRASAGF